MGSGSAGLVLSGQGLVADRKSGPGLHLLVLSAFCADTSVTRTTEQISGQKKHFSCS